MQQNSQLLITTDGESNILHDKTKFKLHLSSNPALQRILETALQIVVSVHVRLPAAVYC